MGREFIGFGIFGFIEWVMDVIDIRNLFVSC